MLALPQYVVDFMSVFQKQGLQIYVVGGAVRNLLLNKNSNNWDFTTNATPKKIQQIFSQSFYNNVYGTVTIPLDNPKLLLEVTPYRRESDYKDSRHPETIVWANTIEEDLARRDFTINAMAYDGKEIIDQYNGQRHLTEKLIVTVGNPDKRFSEDGLRLMRAVRFASELGFLIETSTREAITKNAEIIKKISWERIRDELLKIIASDNPAEGILFLKNTGLLGFILPELDLCFMIPQKSPKRHHIYDVGTHLVMALKHCPSHDPITRLATLLHDIGKVKTFRRDEKTGLITFYNHEVVSTKLAVIIAARLRLSNKQKEKFVRLIQYHQFTVTEIQTDKAVRRFIREVGLEYIQDMLDLRTGDRLGSGASVTSWRLDLFKKRILEVQKEPFKVSDLKINGHDVMTILNLKPGPKVGDILNALFKEVTENKLENDREILLKKVNDIKSLG